MIGANLDITYPDTSKPISSLGYQLIVYWNDPRLIPPDWPNIPQISYPPETSTPTANPSSSPTQTPTPIPTPSTSIQKSTSPSSPVATLQPTNPSPTQATKSPSDPANNSLFPTEYIYWSMAIVTAATVGWIAGLRTKKRKHKNKRLNQEDKSEQNIFPIFFISAQRAIEYHAQPAK